MAGTVLGFMKFILGFDTVAFKKGMTESEKDLVRMQKNFQKVGDGMTDMGKSMSLAITAPLLGIGAIGIKTAANFETAMNSVAISTQATGETFNNLRELALSIGKETTKSASEAADAIDMLAKAGLNSEQILNGAARAAVALAEAAGSELDPAAAAITDTLTLFKKSTADLPNVIDNITGAVNQSKFNFADFQLGMSQAGGVAASSGVEFEDFTAALAATASQFASGSDAGTSFKTFLMRLEPQTKKQAAAFKDLGLSFYDANGQMKSMAEVAQMLQDKFQGMSEQDRTAIFKELFGTDAIRTAIGLMEQGAAGIEKMQAKIAATDASAQAAQRMKGLNAEMEKLGGALETLAIKVADSGLLGSITGLVTKLGEFVDWLGSLNPAVLKWGVGIAAVAAALGPVLIVLGSVVSAVAKMGPLVTGLTTAFTVLTSGLKYLLPVIGAVGKALLGLLGNPIILAAAVVIGGIYLAWKNWDKIAPIVTNMVNGVKNALAPLTGYLKRVENEVLQVRQAFFDMWDKVTRRSYVPDMVDDIAAQFARLDAVMVQPAKKGTDAVKQSFESTRSAVQSLMKQLFPEAERWNTYQANLKLITEQMKKLGYTADQTAEALRRLNEQWAKDNGITDEPLSFPSDVEVELPPLKDVIVDFGMKTDETTARVIDAFGEMAASTIGSIADMRDAFKSGDVLSGIQIFLDMVLNVLSALGQMGMIKLPGMTTPPYGGARARGGPVVPGKSYLVGENGPEFITPRRSGYVHPNGSGLAPQKVMIVPSPYFDAVVDNRAANVAAPLAGRAAVVGVTGSEARMSRRSRRNLLGAS
ncbi:MAG TPA: phage tail tape measure protein [Sphingomicrobium sp.]|nr:phage tail tape measure protein [Sphingomicrobium sp.]